MATNTAIPTQSVEAQTFTPPSIVFSDSAAKKVHELITDENNFNLNLRVYIQGGGCSGFQYGFSFDEKINDDDMVIKRNVVQDEDDSEGGSDGRQEQTVSLLVDSMSYQYLVGAEIDYKDDMDGERFIIRNPNAQTTCGCGSSFSA